MVDQRCITAPAAHVSQVGMQVTARAACVIPEVGPKVYTISTCEPTIFVDCRKTLVIKDPYGGLLMCRKNASAWQEMELDTCPSSLFPLMFDPETLSFWFNDGCAWYQTEWDGESYGDWTKFTGGDVPSCLTEVHINLTTGDPFYLPVSICEEDVRVTIANNPFCTTGYQPA